MDNITIAIVAHVDAGKTTLSESILYHCGEIKKIGRVDHQDVFLDYDDNERKRGITIYSKEARFKINNKQFTMIDTPGHIDFSIDLERALTILDYAIVVISGVDGIQSHTTTILKLLKYYHIKPIVFFNKMDISHQDSKDLLVQLEKNIAKPCINFNQLDQQYENMALCDDDLLDYFIENSQLTKNQINDLIQNNQIIPCYFGSALKNQGIDQLLKGLDDYCIQPNYPQIFGAKIYKLSKDSAGNLLSHIKVTGGALKVKTVLENEEKVDQIRLYQGQSYTTVESINAGMIGTLKGLKNIQVGMGLGFEKNQSELQTQSFITYHLKAKNIDQFTLYQKMQPLNIQNPMLKLKYHRENDIVEITVLGEIQLEIIVEYLKNHENIDVTTSFGNIEYLESIRTKVIGVGHYEPLKHYSEVHVMLEPKALDGQIEVTSTCDKEELDIHYQNIITNFIKQNQIPGVLTRSHLCNIKFTLLNGRSHQKHSQSSDFKEATIRAIRQALMQVDSFLLEPLIKAQIRIEKNLTPKLLFEVEQRNGNYLIANINEYYDVVEVIAPLAYMQDFPLYLNQLTRGKGQYSCQFGGYQEVSNMQEIIEKINYDVNADNQFPSHSIFCKNGAGFSVPYDEVENHMHIQKISLEPKQPKQKKKNEALDLEEIFKMTYGKSQKQMFKPVKKSPETNKKYEVLPECIIVDGYNVMHELEITKSLLDQFDYARSQLLEFLCDYQGYKKCRLIVVFDAYKVKNTSAKHEKFDQIEVVYSASNQSADQYIEANIKDYIKQYNVRVITNDSVEKTIVLAKGAIVSSVKSLWLDYEYYQKNSLETFKKNQKKGKVLGKDGFV